MAIYGEHPIVSKLSFSWITPLIKHHRTAEITDSFLKTYSPKVDVTSDAERLSSTINRESRLKHLSIALAILRTFRSDLFKIVVLSLICLVAGLSSPLILREVLRGLNSDFIPPSWYSSIYNLLPNYLSWVTYPLLASLALSFSSILAIFCTHHLFYIQPILAIRVRTALNSITFSKALRQQRAAQQKEGSGFIINLIGSDSQRLQNLLVFFHGTWHYPTALLVITFLLYRLVGIPAIIGCSSLLLLIISSTVITRKQGRLRSLLAKVADQRISLTRECLIHIKAAKLQGWEENLADKIQALREEEIRLSQRIIQLSAVLSFTSGSAPAIAMAITSIALVHDGSTLDAATLFPVLTLFMQLRFSLNMLPEILYSYIEANLALKRIYSFLISPEFIPPRIELNQGSAVAIRELCALWEPGGAVATTIQDLEIKRGELVVVVGPVGSGKTGLLLTILGELSLLKGSVSISGKLAYVPQNPWIVSDSIRNNIIFGEEVDNDLYKRALLSAGLSLDLASLPNGDSTAIGERGINLSGGQRQRVALARAVYSEADIYLFDDPLSALDPEVAQHVFTNLICSELSTKTRILVSHRIEFALLADRVLVFENGAIVEDGRPEELKERQSHFADLLNAHKGTTPATKVSPGDSAASDVAPTRSYDEIELTGDLSPSSIIEAEERRIGSVLASTVRTYATKLAPGAAGVLLGLLFLARQSAAVGTDLWLAHWANQPKVQLLYFLTGYILCIALLCIVSYARSVYLFRRGLLAGAASHRKLLHGVLHAPLSFFEANPVGRILNRFSRDLETVELSLPRSILDAGQCILETLIVAIVIAFITPVTLLIIIPLTVVYYSISSAFRPVSRDLQRLLSISLSPIFAITSESLSGIESLRAAALGASFNRSFTSALKVYTGYNSIQTAINRWLGVRLETLGALLIGAVGISAALGFTVTGGVALSGLALAYASSMTSSMNWAIRSISMVENNLTSYERIERYSNTATEKLNGDKPPGNWPSAGAITITDLSVRYRPRLPLAIKGITCSIPAGSRVGVIGRTGSGKSTLILSLLRLVEPCGGRIEIDGFDLGGIALKDLRSSISVVPQEPVLFSGTLRESLDPFNEYQDQEILTVLNRVELGDLADSLPNGLNSEVREGGFNFSNGQRQLICLARALLRKSKVVVLDEATASIDVQTDQTIQQAIRREFTDATMIIIAHRLGTIIDSDYILALSEGRLVEYGNPSELLQVRGSLLGRFIDEGRSL